MTSSDAQPGEPDPTTQQELLRQWEERIEEADGDPMAALAELLGARQAARNRLFGMAGETVLGCRLDAILGAGGMGVTYDGVDANGARVAVKLVPAVAESARPRFVQECRLLRELDHPAIVRYRAHDILPDGTGVLVMDLVRGSDLERLLTALATSDPMASGLPSVQELLRDIEERGPAMRLSPRYRRRMLRMFADLASGLHEAHEHGVVHRDVKPGNVLVRDDLSPVLIDFGLARDHQNRVSFTQSGIAMGTLAYMAPEQFGDDPGAVDRRADVYAVGLLLYRALAGADLRREVDDVLKRRDRAFLLDAQQSRALPVDVQAILYRCLDPRPSHRYRTAKELEGDLRAAAAGGSVMARRPSSVSLWMRDRRKVAALVALLVCAASVLVIAKWPVGREVMFAANCRLLDARVVVDRNESLPLGSTHWLPLGVHEVELVGDKILPVRRTIAVTQGEGAQWVTLLTAMPQSDMEVADHAEAGKSLLAWSTGHQWNPIAEGRARDLFRIDGNSVYSSVPGENTVLQPAVYSLSATDGLGRSESQTVDLRASPAVDVQMLPAVMSDRDGAFRATWSCIHSPLPDCMSLETDAAGWTGLAFDPPVPMDLLATPCALTPASAGVESRAVMRCRFPEPMRTAFVYFRARSREPEGLVVEIAMDGEAPQPVAFDAEGKIQRVITLSSERGASSFTISARMKSSVEANLNVAPVRFLEGCAFGGHWADEPPCLAVVADPAPRFGRAARPPQSPKLESLPGLPIEALPHFDPQGRDPFLAGYRPGKGADRRIAWTAKRGDHRTLFEAPLETLRPNWTMEATALHARVDASDGNNFGSIVVHVPDVDGDGEMDRVICDPTSYARGSRFSGLIACFGSRQNELRWKWPRFGTDGKHGDDTATLGGAPLGDWNKDGYPDLVASTARTNPQNGAHKAGYVAVLDGITGEELWSTQGDRHYESLSVIAFHAADSRCNLALQSHYDATDYVRETSFPMCLLSWSSGPSAVATGRIGLVTSPTVGTFVPSRRSKTGVAWIQFVANQRPFSLAAIERYELEGEEVRLTARTQFEEGLFSPYLITGASPVGDLDGDGEGDCAYILATDQKVALQAQRESRTDLPGVLLLVSSGSLQLLAMQLLPGRPWGGIHWTQVPLLVPMTDGMGSDAYMLCTPLNAPLVERKLFKIAFRPMR